MKTMTELDGEEKSWSFARVPIGNAFRKNRSVHGRVWDWHTLEGPFVRKHDGRYYCFYSGWPVGNGKLRGWTTAWPSTFSALTSDAGNAMARAFCEPSPNQLIVPATIPSPSARTAKVEFIVIHAWDKE